jgi:hypothetical protein
MEYEEGLERILDFAAELSKEEMGIAGLTNALNEASDILWAAYTRAVARRDDNAETVH